MDFRTLPNKVKSELAKVETPFFFFDLDRVSEKVRQIRRHIKPDKIYFATKSNSLPQILETIAHSGCGFEVNNSAELEKVIDANATSGQIINSSSKSSAADIREMYGYGVRKFTFDSKDQVDNLAINAPGSKAILRIYSTNEGSRFDLSKNFGIHPSQAPSLLNYTKRCNLDLYGIMFHVGSQCHSLHNWKAGIIESAKLFQQFPDLQIINIGGGFPIDYKETIPNIEEISRVINQTINDYFLERPPICVEPGRFLVGDSALTCTSVIHITEKSTVSRATLDMSVYAGLIEIIEKANGFCYPIETEEKENLRKYKLVGPTCAGTDIIADEVVLPCLNVDHKQPKNNSRLYLLNTGAYSLDYVTVGQSHGFNGAKIPKVYFVKSGEIIGLQ